MNETIVSFWQRYKSAYIKPSNGVTPGGGYYVEMLGTGGDGSEKGTSESQGYGMILSALMAGADSDAKKLFDGLYNMYDQHRSTGNWNLMSWVVPGSERGEDDQGSATDGDMDIAYALLLAHYQWGSNGQINYLAEARRIITDGIKASEMGSWSKRTLLGDWVGEEQLQTRPSDWMPGHMEAFAAATGDDFWLQAKATIFDMITTLQAGPAAATGLLPDFVVGDPARPADPYFLEFAYDGDFYENACRCPLRIAVDYAHHGTPQARTALNKIAQWIIGTTGGDPRRISKGYTLAGAALNDSLDMLHFTAPLVTAAIGEAGNQAFVDSGWNALRFTEASEYWDHYYPNSITLLSMLLISGNWWPPEEVSNAARDHLRTSATSRLTDKRHRAVCRILQDPRLHQPGDACYSVLGRKLPSPRSGHLFNAGIFLQRGPK